MLHRTIFVEGLKFYLSYHPQGGKKAMQLLITNTAFDKVKCCFKINRIVGKDKLLPQALQRRKGQELLKRAGSRVGSGRACFK